MYGRVDLSKIEYKLDKEIINKKPTLEEATEVFRAYCLYKDFASVYPYDDINPYEWNCLYEKQQIGCLGTNIIVSQMIKLE